MTDRRPAPVARKAPPLMTVKAPPRGEVPHPRRPRVVRAAAGNWLMDLFAFFPDLPRPARISVLPRRQLIRAIRRR